MKSMQRSEGWASTRVGRVVATGLVKRYGPTVALRGVSAVFVAGKTTIIEGANGSGKSTLLGILGGVVIPSGGSLEYHPLGQLGDEVRAQIGWVSHDSLAYGDLTGRQNVELAARLQGVDERDAWTRAEERFELGGFASRPLRTNSRGQKQRVALARALIHHPSVLLLDEPTTGLDRAGVKRLLAVVEEERRRDVIVILVSHEPEVFEGEAVEKLCLERGRRIDQRAKSA